MRLLAALCAIIRLTCMHGLQDVYGEEFVDLSIPRELQWKAKVETQLYARTGASAMAVQLFVKISEPRSYNVFILDRSSSKYVHNGHHQRRNIQFMERKIIVCDWNVALGPHSVVVIGELTNGKLVSTPVIVNLKQYVKGVEKMNRRYKLLYFSIAIVTTFFIVGIIVVSLKS